MDIIEGMLAHAREDAQHEVCGLVVASGKKQRLIRARNVGEQPRFEFDLDPNAWLEVGDDESVVAIYHSHPFTRCEPSMADLRACELTQLPWFIVTPGGDHTYFEPSGYEAPYEGRPYVWGVMDCYALVQDWFSREHAIHLAQFERVREFWRHGIDLFGDNIEGQGFVDVRGQEPKRGDLFLIQFQSHVPNHIVIYLGDGKILHHAHGRLSVIEQWVGMWSQCATRHFRHKDLINA
jgi:proteasome lid subunit RPN8/RPN11